MRTLAAAALFALLLSGCGGSPGPALAPAAPAQVIGPLSEADVQVVADSGFPQPPMQMQASSFAQARLAFSAARPSLASLATSRRTQSLTVSDEVAGFITQGTGAPFMRYYPHDVDPYNGVFVYHSLYLPRHLSLPTPDPAFPLNTFEIEAPITKVPTGCLEVGTLYPASGTPSLEVTDYCAGLHETVLAPIDRDFLARYVRKTSTRPASYALSILPDPLTTISTSPLTKWSAMLWNFRSQQWDVIFTTVPAYFMKYFTGSSLFYAHYPSGAACPAIPTFSIHDLQMFNATRHEWEYVVPSMANGVTSSPFLPHPTGCFVGTGGTAPSYLFQVNQHNYGWTVSSVARL